MTRRPAAVPWSRTLGRWPTFVFGAGASRRLRAAGRSRRPWSRRSTRSCRTRRRGCSRPRPRHAFGTDNFGRDILSRVIWGARIDLQIAVLGVIFPFVIGTLVGTVAGYFGGIVDTLFMRLVDIVLAFPFLVLMLAIIAILGPGLTSFYIAMALVGWVSYARLIRAQILVLKTSRLRRRRRQPRLQPRRASCSATCCRTRSPARWSSPCPTPCWCC